MTPLMMLQGQEATNVTAAGIVFVVLMCLLTFVLPRWYAYVPMLLTACWMTLGQRLVIASINLPALRLVIACVLIRLVVRAEYQRLRLVTIDKAVFAWMASSVFLYLIREPDMDGVISRAGFFFNAIGIYLGFRCWVQSYEDVLRVVRVMAFALPLVAGMMMVEKVTGKNYFSYFGGVPLMTEVRLGTVRAQGPFSHPILAGTLGAVWFPVFVALWWQGKRYRWVGVLGALSATTMTATSGSSGPLFAYLVALLGLGMWLIRHQMRIVRIGLVIALVLLQLSMSSPIWFIFARINILSGSTGWHRANLIDQSVRHFLDWVLFGIRDITHWGVFMGDITNHYLLEGLRAGFLTMVLFILIIVMSYSYVGRMMRRQAVDRDWQGRYRMIWSLGVMMTAHSVTFFSVAYFDPQSMLHWFVTVVLLASLYASRPRGAAVAGPEEEAAQSRMPWWGDSHSAAQPPPAPALLPAGRPHQQKEDRYAPVRFLWGSAR